VARSGDAPRARRLRAPRATAPEPARRRPTSVSSALPPRLRSGR
jgi:hypothetical protein